MYAIQDVPDEFIPCIISYRHFIRWGSQTRQRVRISYDGGRGRPARTLDLIEYVGTCQDCGTVRTMLRTDPRSHDGADEFVKAEYQYPEGYLAPKGEPWDRLALRAEWARRHPVGRKVQTRSR